MNVTLITGASGGIGEALASRLAARKHNLLLVARNAGKLEQQCRQLAQAYGISAQYIAADLSKIGAPQQVFEEARARGLEVDMLINNAGIGSGGAFSELLLKDELALLQLNNASLVAMTHLFLRPMQARGRGTIINVASMAAFIPFPYMATYAASKAFVRSFTQAITEECKPYGIHVMLLCPGLTRTNFNRAAGIENNEKSKGLNIEYSSTTQTPEQVSDEALRALDRKKHVIVSGRMNRLAANLSALLPNAIAARGFARSYRKRTGK